MIGTRTEVDRRAVLATWLTRAMLIATLAILVVRLVQLLPRAADAATLAAVVFILAHLVWLGVEAPVTFRRLAESPTELRTMLGYACARVLLIVGAVVPPIPWDGWSGWILVPFLLFGAGVVLRLAAIRELGAQYTHHVVRRTGHHVVTTGPYRYLRHPAYTGMLVANLGFVGFFHHPVAVLALLALAGAVYWRARTEERALWDMPGYREFARTRAGVLGGFRWR
ncbi:isoprenylcysteine carboxylmethyltransferase family protein [Actinophytocola sp.]|jgi:protein-S-isoprenylcysteine O-methyltransferase Ste14|uniref:methyltransferase family protein n=1 Tax=Actinophytocola sp. TaxID=1872138 RepID=UPI002EDA275E